MPLFLSLILNLNNFTFNLCYLCYHPFVNNIFMISIGSEQELNGFFAKLNSTIKFECKYFNIQINFLDTMVCINKSNTLTTTYKKEMDRNVYLHYNIYHKQKLKDNIPYGKFLCVNNICSDTNDTENSLNDQKTNLMQQGYPNKLIQRQLTEAH